MLRTGVDLCGRGLFAGRDFYHARQNSEPLARALVTPQHQPASAKFLAQFVQMGMPGIRKTSASRRLQDALAADHSYYFETLQVCSKGFCQASPEPVHTAIVADVLEVEDGEHRHAM